MWQHKHIGIPGGGTLVGITLLVVWVGSAKLVETFVDDGNIVDLVAVFITTDIHISNNCTTIRYGYTHI